MSSVTLTVNGVRHTVDVDPSVPLLDVLSHVLALRGPKFGCGLAQCGACTVLANRRAIRSCVTPVGTVSGADIVTLEGLGTPDRLHPLQQAFLEEQAVQCGFCLSGVILTTKALFDGNPRASDEEIRRALAAVLCRCGVHVRMWRAIKRYQQSLLAQHGQPDGAR